MRHSYYPLGQAGPTFSRLGSSFLLISKVSACIGRYYAELQLALMNMQYSHDIFVFLCLTRYILPSKLIASYVSVTDKQLLAVGKCVNVLHRGLL